MSDQASQQQDIGFRARNKVRRLGKRLTAQ
jgi:hypothetical protein